MRGVLYNVEIRFNSYDAVKCGHSGGLVSRTVGLYAYQKRVVTEWADCSDCERFLRATAVPAGTADSAREFCLSVRLSVRHDPVRIQCQVRYSGSSPYDSLESL